MLQKSESCPVHLSKEGFERKFFLKFAVDRVFASILLIFTSPLILLIAFGMWVEGLVKKDAKGPVFYREKRISGGKPFFLYKFRVLKMSALAGIAKDSSVWFLQFEKKNTTLMGKILIQCYLDELPQLFNIFLGQMTFVGPRPHAISVYEEDLRDGYTALKYVKGGITGPAQLAKGVVKNAMPLSEDYMAFCQRSGPWALLKYDLGIMWKSVFKLMKAEGL